MTQLPSQLPHESTVSSAGRTTLAPDPAAPQSTVTAPAPANPAASLDTSAAAAAAAMTYAATSTAPAPHAVAAAPHDKTSTASAGTSNSTAAHTTADARASAMGAGAANAAVATSATRNQPHKKSPRLTGSVVQNARKLVHFVPQDYAHGTVNNRRALGDRVTWVNSKQVVDAVKTHHEQQHSRNRELIQEIAERQGEISESSALKALYEHSLRQVGTGRTATAASHTGTERSFSHGDSSFNDALVSRNASLSRQSSYSNSLVSGNGNTAGDTANTLASGTIITSSDSNSGSGGSALGRLTPQQQQLSAQLADSQPSLLVPPLVNAEQHHEQSALQQGSEQNIRAHEQPNNIMKAQLRFLDEPSLPGFGIYQGDTNQILLDRHAVRLLKFDQSLQNQWLSFYQVRRMLGTEITHQLLEHLRQLKDAYPESDHTDSAHTSTAQTTSTAATAQDYAAAATAELPKAPRAKTAASAAASATTAPQAQANATTNTGTGAGAGTGNGSMNPTLRQDLEDGVRIERETYQKAHATYEQNPSLSPDSLKISSYPALFQFTLQPYGHMWHGVYHEELPHNRHAYRRDSSYEPYVHTKRIRHSQYRNVTYDINLTGLNHGIMFKVQTPLGPEEIWQRVELQERHDLIACHNALLALLIAKVANPAIKYTVNLDAAPQNADVNQGADVNANVNVNVNTDVNTDITASTTTTSLTASDEDNASAAPASHHGNSLQHPTAKTTVDALLTVPFMIKNLRLLANWYPVFTFALNPCTGHCASLSCNHTIQYAPYAYTGDNMAVIEPALRLGFKLGLDAGAGTSPQEKSAFNTAAAAVVNATNTAFAAFNLADDDAALNQHQHYFIPSNSDIDDIELSATEPDYKGLSRCTFAIYLPSNNGQSEKLYIKLNAFFKDNGNINYISFTFTRIASKLFELMPHMVADSASLDWLLPTDECIYGRNYYTILGFKHNDPSIPYRHKLWLKTLVHPEDLATIHQDHKILQDARSGNVVELLYRTKCRDGSYIWTKGVSTVLGRDRAGKGTRVLEVNIDINRVLEGYEQLQNKVFTDILTGLRNRTYLITHMQQFIRDCTGPLTIIFADITALKLYNDYLGHAIGDKLLCSAAILIKSAINRNNELIRISGDEIVCLLPNCNEQEANLVSQQIVAARRQYNKNAPIRMPVFFSIGCKTVDFSAYTGRDLHGEEKEEALAIFYEAIQTADQIMQENKKLAKPQHYSLVQAYIEKSLNQSISLQDNRLF